MEEIQKFQWNGNVFFFLFRISFLYLKPKLHNLCHINSFAASRRVTVPQSWCHWCKNRIILREFIDTCKITDSMIYLCYWILLDSCSGLALAIICSITLGNWLSLIFNYCSIKKLLIIWIPCILQHHARIASHKETHVEPLVKCLLIVDVIIFLLWII